MWPDISDTQEIERDLVVIEANKSGITSFRVPYGNQGGWQMDDYDGGRWVGRDMGLDPLLELEDVVNDHEFVMAR